MTSREINKAKKLLADRAQRFETLNLDSGGHALSVTWTCGFSHMFYTLDDVQRHIEDHSHSGAER